MGEFAVGEFAIVARALSKTFNAHRAIDDVNLSVPTGSRFAIIGRQGAGKTTLLRLLLGLLEPSAGSVEVLGYDVRTDSSAIRQLTSVLWRDAGVYERLTVSENLAYYGHIWHMQPGDLRTRSRDLLTRLSLWDMRNHPARSLTPLQRRRLTLARAVIHRPTLLFADEPTYNLVPDDQAAFQRDLSHLLMREGLTCLFTATANDAAYATSRDALLVLATHAAILHQGQLIAQGPIDAFKAGAHGPVVEIVGRGFSDAVVALVHRRREVETIQRIGNRLILQLRGDYDTAPLVSLLVEASADVEEVRRYAPGALSMVDALLCKEPET